MLTAQISNRTLIAFGGFSEIHLIDGKIVKVLEDGCWSDTVYETVMQKQAADAGLAPQVHAVTELDGSVIVVMDPVAEGMVNVESDEDDGCIPTLLGDLDLVDALEGLTLYARLIAAGIVHADFHTGNWFMNAKRETQAIDFGISSRLVDAPEKHLKRAIQTMLPVLEAAGYNALGRLLRFSWEMNDADEMRAAVEVAALEFLQDQDA